MRDVRHPFESSGCVQGLSDDTNCQEPQSHCRNEGAATLHLSRALACPASHCESSWKTACLGVGGVGQEVGGHLGGFAGE